MPWHGLGESLIAFVLIGRYSPLLSPIWREPRAVRQLSKDPEANLGVAAYFQASVAVRPRANRFTFLCLNFLPCKWCV